MSQEQHDAVVNEADEGRPHKHRKSVTQLSAKEGSKRQLLLDNIVSQNDKLERAFVAIMLLQVPCLPLPLPRSRLGADAVVV